ncbi:MAG: phosphatase PAP2 family protein [Bacteroidota bacterium]|nr:phosphatase PAP2 family protein [Bacteroidota bacterium]MDP4231736.1 phosphatase PAP2 family protein [Bacteroidota bacterium]MDP4243472.1 phosphatase PAP2 family protein [Bacteroidota bacterium]MDP4289363.1 phosphatase PAP2 family protein [Bacteroidota bacterium]
MYEIDLAILHFFNQSLACSALDTITSVLTNVRYWYPVYLLGGLFLIYRYKWHGARMLLAAILLITVTDSFAHLIIKPLVNRPRPCATLPDGSHVVSWIRLPDGARWDGSFPSNHALNNFAIAAFFVTLWPKKRRTYWLLGAALLISLSRIYEGVHYPSDVLGGTVIGIVFGIGFASLQRVLERSLQQR